MFVTTYTRAGYYSQSWPTIYEWIVLHGDERASGLCESACVFEEEVRNGRRKRDRGGNRAYCLSCDEDEDGEPEEKSKGWFGKKNKRKSSVRASIKKVDIAFTAPPEEEDMVFFHAFFRLISVLIFFVRLSISSSLGSPSVTFFAETPAK